MNRAYVLHPYVIIGIGIIVFLFVCVYHVREGFAATLNCQGGVTGWQIEGGGNAIYLDRLNVQCAENQMLSRFQIQRSGNGWWRL